MDNIEKKLYDALSKIKNKDSKIYQQALEMLEFIYKDIKQGYFDKEQKSLEILYQVKRNSSKYDFFSSISSNSYNIDTLEKSVFNSIVENEFGIIDCLIELCNSADKRFTDKFFESISVPIDMLKRGIYPNSNIYLYAFNIYTMLYAYHVNKNNYENFAVVVDDISSFFIASDTDKKFYDKNVNYNYRDYQDVICSIVENRNYKDLEILRDLLKKTLSKVENEPFYHYVDEYEQYVAMFKQYNELYSSEESLRAKGYQIDEKLVRKIAFDMSIYGIWEGKDSIKIDVFYAPILLFGNRYDFIKEILNRIEPNHTFKKEIFEHIASLDYELFEYINGEDKEKDSFIDCMKIVFDSDTYQEMMNKLLELNTASTLFKCNKKEQALEKIKELDSEKNKQKYDGKILKWPSNGINIPERPDQMIDRMQQIYLYYNNYPVNKSSIEKYKQDEYQKISDFLSEFVETILVPEESKKPEVIPEEPKKSKVKKGFFSYFN